MPNLYGRGNECQILRHTRRVATNRQGNQFILQVLVACWLCCLTYSYYSQQCIKLRLIVSLFILIIVKNMHK